MITNQRVNRWFAGPLLAVFAVTACSDQAAGTKGEASQGSQITPAGGLTCAPDEHWADECIARLKERRKPELPYDREGILPSYLLDGDAPLFQPQEEISVAVYSVLVTRAFFLDRPYKDADTVVEPWTTPERKWRTTTPQDAITVAMERANRRAFFSKNTWPHGSSGEPTINRLQVYRSINYALGIDLTDFFQHAFQWEPFWSESTTEQRFHLFDHVAGVVDRYADKDTIHQEAARLDAITSRGATYSGDYFLHSLGLMTLAGVVITYPTTGNIEQRRFRAGEGMTGAEFAALLCLTRSLPATLSRITRNVYYSRYDRELRFNVNDFPSLHPYTILTPLIRPTEGEDAIRATNSGP